jgi:hypothetical protein
MKHRKLRIAWSVAWSVVAVLLIALWVRSYWTWDTVSYYTDPYDPIKIPRTVEFESWRGVCAVYSEPIGDFSELPFFQRWTHSTKSPPVWIPETQWSFKNGDPEDRHEFKVPHWFLLGIIGTVAATPWLYKQRRFSLRTLLIATTLVAMGLAAIVWQMRG